MRRAAKSDLGAATMKTPDQELACQKRKAANRAFREFFALHRDEVQEFLIRYFDGDQKSAEAALTLTFFQVYRNLHCSGLCPNRAELFTIATDHAADLKGMDSVIPRSQFFALREISAGEAIATS
jgi:DNA-directed RNA polymerase specialized sigma24 family protein